MPAMSPFEAAVCRSAPWRLVARRLVLPWALQGIRPQGKVLEIGAGSGAMAAGCSPCLEIRVGLGGLAARFRAVAVAAVTTDGR